ncbi:MAG: hypothetical protein HRT54_15505 [Colwellia sp.]|nr:hypothetical protein [Colwellia sp.]
MKKMMTDGNKSASRDTKNKSRNVYWMFTWAVPMVLVDYVKIYDWYSLELTSMKAIILTSEA